MERYSLICSDGHTFARSLDRYRYCYIVSNENDVTVIFFFGGGVGNGNDVMVSIL
jgi:hypothetical protein